MAKIKVAPGVKDTVHNDGLGGVKVTIQLHNPTAGVEMMISLPGPCVWNGRLLNQVQRFFTDEAGRVVVMLPPSNEIKPLLARNPVPVPYKLTCVPTGTLTFEVPNVPEWTLGT